uniref:cadherin-2-like n=1 Tax=Centroberyx gerrardi TaxID=166262 RepID=UPI003AAB2B80
MISEWEVSEEGQQIAGAEYPTHSNDSPADPRHSNRQAPETSRGSPTPCPLQQTQAHPDPPRAPRSSRPHKSPTGPRPGNRAGQSTRDSTRPRKTRQSTAAPRGEGHPPHNTAKKPKTPHKDSSAHCRKKTPASCQICARNSPRPQRQQPADESAPQRRAPPPTDQPAQPPDPNPIEHPREQPDRKAREKRPTSQPHLRQAPQEARGKAPPEHPKNPTARTPKVVHAGGQEDGGQEGCVPGFQVKHYQVEYSGPFQKGQPLTQVEFDDCAGNEGVTFEVSDPSFHVDGDLNLVPRRDVLRSGPLMFIHGLSAHADDMAQVDVAGLPVQSPHTLGDILGLGQTLPYRSKRSLLVPPMIVTENQRAPFPRNIGRSHVISAEKPGNYIFRLTGHGADQDPKGLFTINMDTGDVSVSRSLDREAIDSYQLEVSTTDLGGNLVEGPAILVVIVIDQNDNRPIFKETRYSGEVLEGSPTD